MTTTEFSNAFDTLLNSYSISTTQGISQTIGGLTLDEYEKSLFLTQAQEQIVIELYTGRNIKSAAFEETEELRANLRSLIKTETLLESNDNHKGISKYSKFFTLPKDLLFITYEYATISDNKAGCKDNSDIIIIPVTQNEYYNVINNPFRQSNDRRALRLDTGLNIVEIISKYNITDYTIRYLSKPKPIILANLSENPNNEPERSNKELSINNISDKTECELDSSIHPYILERAVALALASRSIGNQK